MAFLDCPKDEQAQELFYYVSLRIHSLSRLSKFILERVDQHEQNLSESVDKGSRRLTTAMIMLDEFATQKEFAPKSLVLMSFALFEHGFDAISDRFGCAVGAGVKLKHIVGQGMVRAGLYNAKVVGVPVTSLGQWETLLLWQGVRNGIAHNDGVVRNKNKIPAIRSKLGIDVDDDGHIGELSPTHLRSLQGTIEMFFRDYAELAKYHPDRFSALEENLTIKGFKETVDGMLSKVDKSIQEVKDAEKS